VVGSFVLLYLSSTTLLFPLAHATLGASSSLGSFPSFYDGRRRIGFPFDFWAAEDGGSPWEPFHL